MRIAIFQSQAVNPNKGGISRMSKAYMDIFTSQGHCVWYVSMSKDDEQLQPRQLFIDGSDMTEKQESFSLLLREHQIQLLIYQNGITPYLNFIIRWTKECKVKIVDILHNSLRGMYGINGHPRLSQIKPQIINRAVNKCINRFFMIKYGKYYREQFELSDKVVLLSDKFRDEITYFTGWYDFTKFTSIFNPLTLVPPKTINENKKKIVLHVALLNEQKRQDLLLDIWKNVEAQRPEWCLKIVGDGNMRKRLVSQSRRLGLRNVHFLGYQSPEPYYDEASIFCLTSAYEGFGLVLVESMSYGCAPMAFNSFETVSDIIEDGVNGKLIKPFSVEDYARELLDLIDNNAKRNKMQRKAVEASKQFDMETIGKNWRVLLNDFHLE